MFYKWKAKYGGLEVSDAKRLKAPEGENAKLKKLLAEAMLTCGCAAEPGMSHCHCQASGPSAFPAIRHHGGSRQATKGWSRGVTGCGGRSRRFASACSAFRPSPGPILFLASARTRWRLSPAARDRGLYGASPADLGLSGGAVGRRPDHDPIRLCNSDGGAAGWSAYNS